MKTSTKVFFNTVVLYAKIVISMAISLISVPLVLSALGASDYGLYNLVAGVVAMLSFLSSSLTVSSQRYMSVAMGTNDHDRINIVYNSSFWLHLLLGAVVVIILECGSLFIDKFNIEPSRLNVAQLIYQFLIVSTFIKIIAVPFDALMNAHEDMLPFAIIEIIDSFFILLTALLLRFIQTDRLAFYGLCICLIAFITILMKYGWCKYKYLGYKIEPIKKKEELITKEMFSFAGWNLFGSMALIGRNQGVAIIINMFLGTIVNAAYGIANQINGALSQFSVTFQKAINPQLMKSEGMNDRKRLLKIAYISSKFSVLALSSFAIPLIIEMPDVLILWLGDDCPPYSIEFSRYILLLTIVYQLSVGIASAIQAVGTIRNYQITISFIVILNIPLSYFIISMGYPVYYTTLGFIFLEVVSMIMRIIYAKKLVHMSPVDYIRHVVSPSAIIILVASLFCLLPHYLVEGIWSRLIATCLVYGIVFAMALWLFGLDEFQKKSILYKLKELKLTRKQ